MRAAVCRSYGPPEILKIEDVEEPSALEDHQVLVRVRYASVNPVDYHMRRGSYAILRIFTGRAKPKQEVLGTDVAGTVEAVGKNVTRFKVGDKVFGGGRGTHAEYAISGQKSLSLLPENVTFQEAAAVPVAALTALQALRDVAKMEPGQKVLVYGASGGIGHLGVQLARALGAAEVGAVCSTANLSWVKELGPDYVIDYTKENFAANGKKYDIILDAVGKRTYFNCRQSLTDTGVYISEHFLHPWYNPLQIALSPLLPGHRKARIHIAAFKAGDMDFLGGLMAEGKLRPVIEKVYPLEEIAAAHRHVEGWHTKGKVVIEVDRG
ncbi:MAG: NAD(P)-dependent alcohol dehydrogenase [Symbiobacteriaceae bacterium]|nr:NAD(P)-dependent alcohol dehydrogenase [Symbiobacteriaceae bacterium]